MTGARKDLNSYEDSVETGRGLKRKSWFRRQIRKLKTGRFWQRRFPLLGFLRHYDVGQFVSDVIAGITIALTFIPGYMAAAVVTGLPPQNGLYGCIACYFVYSVLGSRPCLVVGPMLVLSLICRPYVDTFGEDVAFTISFYSGCLVTVLGFLNMGFLVNFISGPILEGFLSAASINAISSQLSPLLGMTGGGGTFISCWKIIINNLKNKKIRLWDSVLGVTCIVALVLLQHIQRFSKLPDGKEVTLREKIFRGVIKYVSLGRTAIVVIISTCIVSIVSFNNDGVPPVIVAGNVTEGLPQLITPKLVIEYDNKTLSFSETMSELAPSITIPLVIIIISNVAAKAVAIGPSIDTVQELLAIGIANIACSFMQSGPSLASVSWSLISKNAGSRTPITCVFAGFVVMAALKFFSSALRFLPNATLAAIIITSLYRLVNVHKDTKHLWNSNNKLDLLPLYTTFIGSLLFGLNYGMLFGIIAHMLLLLSFSARPNVEIEELEIQGRKVRITRPDGNVDYPGADTVRKIITKPLEHAESGLIIVIDGLHISRLDSTAIKVFNSIVKIIKISGNEVIFWNWNDKFTRKFDKCFRFRNGSCLEQIVCDEFSIPRSTPNQVEDYSDAESLDSRGSTGVLRNAI